jgi:DNA-binding NarL/FixJ family response regulator
MVWEPQPHPPALLCLLTRVVVEPPILPAMDAVERYEVLSRYAEHMRRLEEIASQRNRALDQDRPDAEVVPIHRAVEPEHQPTTRELEVLRLIAEGLTSGEISKRLYLSDETIRSHVRGLFAAMRVNSRAQAVAVGFRRGMIA